MAHFRKAEWRNPNQQKIDTGWKAFDRQTTSISHGQVCGGTQMSKCIRSTSANWPLGQPAKPGEMRRYDLQSFEKIHGYLPWSVINWLNMNADKEVILYEFSHRSRKKKSDETKKVVHGYIITTYDGELLHRYDRRSDKSRKVMDVCQSFVVALDEQPKSEEDGLKFELTDAWKGEGNSSRVTFDEWLANMADNDRGTLQKAAQRLLELRNKTKQPAPHHEAPTHSKLSESDGEFPPKSFPYRVFKGESGKIMPFSEWGTAAGHTKVNKGDVLYMHDGKRWRIWTSAGLI